MAEDKNYKEGDEDMSKHLQEKKAKKYNRTERKELLKKIAKKRSNVLEKLSKT